MLHSLPEKRIEIRRANTISIADRSLPTHVMERLDNEQRRAILLSVAQHNISIDEALRLVSEYYDAETGLAKPPEPPEHMKASEADLDEIFDLMEKSSRMDNQRTAMSNGVGLESTGPTTTASHNTSGFVNGEARAALSADGGASSSFVANFPSGGAVNGSSKEQDDSWPVPPPRRTSRNNRSSLSASE